MAVTRDQVLEVLRPVEDPELRRSIVDLDMVRNIEILDSKVAVTIALTVAGCPLIAEITHRVSEAIKTLPGIDTVGVDMTVMTPDELQAVRQKMGASTIAADAHAGDAHAGHDHAQGEGHGHKEDRTIPFAKGSRTRVIGVTSGKGGVGKSSVTVNLAVALARQGHEVAVLDADVYGFSVPKMLGVTDEPDVIGEMMIPPVAHGVRCISIGFFVDDDKPIMWRGPMLHKALEQFLVDVEWGQPDFLLVDMPPGTGDVAMSMANYLPNAEILVVTTPQPAAQRVAQRSGMMARELKLPLMGVIENMSWFTGNDGERYELFGAGGGAELAEKLGVPMLAQVPLAPALREGSDTGKPILVAEPDSEVGYVFEQLALQIEKIGPRRVYREELKVT